MLVGVVLGALLGAPPVAAGFAIFGIWSGLSLVAPLLAIPSLVLVSRRRAVAPALAFSAAALLAFLVVLACSVDLSKWGLGAVAISAWVAFCAALLASPAVLLLGRAT